MMPEISAEYAKLVKAFALLLFVVWLFVMRKPIADWLRREHRGETGSRLRRLFASLRGKD